MPAAPNRCLLFPRAAIRSRSTHGWSRTIPVPIYRWALPPNASPSTTAYPVRTLTGSRSAVTRRRLPPSATENSRDETGRGSRHSDRFEWRWPAHSTEREFTVDEGPRADTSYEALAKLRPAFHAHGVVTAGNSSQTSDGAAAAVVMSAERAKQLGAPAACALRLLCLRGMYSRGDGDRACLCRAQGAQVGRAHT